jgi:NAD(P)-dependent dehydrogenase (short-subunit alcohol dehydrogenase family)
VGRLDGKVALITGAGSGLGRAAARRFAAEGAQVAWVDRDTAGIEDGAFALAADVTDEAAIEAAVAATIERFGRVDILYANAGVPSAGQVHETSLAEWRRVLDVNLTGVFLSVRAVLGDMLARGSGSILLQASLGGIAGVRGIAAYSASKGGVVALARQMAADYAERGIRVNAICPATVMTPLVEAVYRERAGSEQAARRDIAERERDFPLGHMGDPDDVANLALFLASDEAKWITGAVHSVDGGATAVSLWSPRPAP